MHVKKVATKENTIILAVAEEGKPLGRSYKVKNVFSSCLTKRKNIAKESMFKTP